MKKTFFVIVFLLTIVNSFTQQDKLGLIDSAMIPKPYPHYRQEYAKAKDLLLSTPFQKVHQTYARTGLWMQICEKLNIPFEPSPLNLGEDRLVRFGAYREYA